MCCMRPKWNMTRNPLLIKEALYTMFVLCVLCVCAYERKIKSLVSLSLRNDRRLMRKRSLPFIQHSHSQVFAEDIHIRMDARYMWCGQPMVRYLRIHVRTYSTRYTHIKSFNQAIFAYEMVFHCSHLQIETLHVCVWAHTHSFHTACPIPGAIPI